MVRSGERVQRAGDGSVRSQFGGFVQLLHEKILPQNGAHDCRPSTFISF